MENTRGGIYERGKRLTLLKQLEISKKFKICKDIATTARLTKTSYQTAKKYALNSNINNKRGRPENCTKIRNEMIFNYIQAFTYQFPTAFNRILIQRLNNRFSIAISKSNMSKIKKKLNIKRKRVSLCASQTNSPRIRQLRVILSKMMVKLDKEDIIWVDETHLRSSDLKPRYVYTNSIHNKEITASFSQNINCSFIVAMSYSKVVAVYFKDCVDEGCTSIDYIDFLELIPRSPNTIFFQDNAGIHTSDIVVKYQKKFGFRVINNVPYSCDLNPIELLFNIVKSELRYKRGIHRNNIKDVFIEICKNISKQTINSLVNNVYNKFYHI